MMNHDRAIRRLQVYVALLATVTLGLVIAMCVLTYRIDAIQSQKVRVGLLGYVCGHVAGSPTQPILYCRKLDGMSPARADKRSQ